MYNSLYRGSWCSGMKCGHNWGKTLDCWMQVCLFALHIYVEASNSNSFVTMVMPWAIMWFTVSCLKTIMESWSNFTCRAKQFNWRAVAEKFAAPTKGEMFNTYWRFIKRLNSGLGMKGPTLPLQINSVKWIASQITVDVLSRWKIVYGLESDSIGVWTGFVADSHRAMIQVVELGFLCFNCSIVRGN